MIKKIFKCFVNTLGISGDKHQGKIVCTYNNNEELETMEKEITQTLNNYLQLS